jgi:hypothetical protein
MLRKPPALSDSARSMPRRVLLSCLAAVALGGTGAAGQAAGATDSALQATCAAPQVRVQGASPVDLKDVCAGAGDALDFLRSRGLSTEAVLTIEVTSKLPDVVAPTAAGCFLPERNRAYLLTYAQFKKQRTWFGLPISRTLYRSLATHEAAHALAACNFTVKNSSIQATEYIAYVTMFSTMPSALRARALRSVPGTGFSDADRVTAIAYVFDPVRFGAEAYRHFNRLPESEAFIKRIVAGEVLAD